MIIHLKKTSTELKVTLAWISESVSGGHILIIEKLSF